MSEAVTREELYKQVWAESMLRVAERYEVSSSYMARVCTALNVPRPAAGYWAKHAVGKAPPVIPLPVATPGDQLDWMPGRALDLPLPKPVPSPGKSRKSRAALAVVSVPTSGEHRMLSGIEGFFENAKEVEGYLKPSKRLMADILTTKKGLKHALATAKATFTELEQRGCPVTFATGTQISRLDVDEREGISKQPHQSRYPTPWRPDRATVVHIDSVAIGLALVESSEQIEVAHVKGSYLPVAEILKMKGGARILAGTWTTKRYVPTGLLRLVAYAPYRDVEWRKSWRESPSRPLVDDLKKIASELVRATPEINRLITEAQERQRIAHEEWQAQRRAWDEQEARRKVAEERKRRVDDLTSIFSEWEREQRIVTFIDEMISRASRAPEPERSRLLVKAADAKAILLQSDAFKRFEAWLPPSA